MQRLSGGKGYREKEKEDNQEEEDNQIMQTLLDINGRRPRDFVNIPYPSQENVNQKELTQDNKCIQV